MAIVIELDVKVPRRGASLARLEASLKAVEDRVARIENLWDRATASVNRYSSAVRSLPAPSARIPSSLPSRAASQGGRAAGGPRSSGGARNPGGRAPDDFDIFQSLSRLNKASGGKLQSQVDAAAQKALASLQGQNTAAALRKITTIQVAQIRQANKPNPVLQAILTSRFNIGGSGGGVSPLIGRTLKAAGPALLRLAAAAGPAGNAIAAAGAAAIAAAFAINKMASVAIERAKVLKSIGQGRAATGGSLRDFESLRAASQIAGTSPDALASQISEALQSGAGAALAQRLGISTVRGPFGDINDAAAANKVIAAIANAGSQGEADRLASQSGNKSLGQFFNLTPGEKKLISEGAAGAPSERSVRAGRELSAQMDRLAASFERLLRSAPVVAFMEGLARAFEILTEMIDNWVRLINFIASKLGVGQQVKDVQKEHTDAMKTHAKALRDFGTFGGGPNAAGALPGIRGQHLGDAAVRNALGGAF